MFARKPNIRSEPLIPSLALNLKSDQYTAAEHPALAIDLQRPEVAGYTVLKVEQITGVNDRLGPERQSEIRQILRDHYAQARIVNCQLALERVNCENSGLRGETIHGLQARTGFEVGGNLAEKRLEDRILKDL